MWYLVLAGCGSLGLSASYDKGDTGVFGSPEEDQEESAAPGGGGDDSAAEEESGGSESGGGTGRDTGRDTGAPPADTGAPPATTVPLQGESYAILPDELVFVEPPGVGALLSAYLDASLLLYVHTETSTSLGFSVTLGTAAGEQDPCERILSLPTAAWSDPAFQVGPTPFTTTIGGEVMTLHDLEITGIFEADGSAWQDGVVSAVLDAREVDAALNGLSMCDLVVQAGGSCTACDDGAQTCTTLRAESVTGQRRIAPFDTNPDTSGC